MEEIIRITHLGKIPMIVKAGIKIGRNGFCDAGLCDLSNLCDILSVVNPCDEIDYKLPKDTQVTYLTVIKPGLFLSSYLKHNKLI